MGKQLSKIPTVHRAPQGDSTEVTLHASLLALFPPPLELPWDHILINHTTESLSHALLLTSATQDVGIGKKCENNKQVTKH